MADPDPRLTRMLARHFPDLQGLRDVAYAVFLQTVTLVWLATRSQRWTIVAALAAVPFLLAGEGMLDRYYARFGRVVTKRGYGWALRASVLAAVFLQPFAPSGFPNLMWSTLAFGALWLAWNCWPDRWHQLLVFAAMIYVAFGRVAYPDAGDVAWMAPRVWAFTTALTIAGVLDHRLFLRVMRQTHAPATIAS